jgi:hypothetical protein
MKEILPRGSTSQRKRVFIGSTGSANGDGRTGLAHNTAGLEIWVLPIGNGAPNVYTAAAGKIESIAAVGTYVAPTQSDRIRFGQVDATNAPGLYELQFRDELFAAGTSIVGAVRGVADAIVCPFELQLSDPVRGVGSPTALPDAATDSPGGLVTWYRIVGPGGGDFQLQNATLHASTLAEFWNTLTSAVSWASASFARLLINQLPKIGAGTASSGSVVNGEEIEFFVGEDCLATFGRSIDFLLDLTFDGEACDWSIDIGPRKGAAVFSQAGAATLISGSTYLVRFEPEAAKTSDAEPYTEYGYTVTATNAAGKVSGRVEGVAKTRRLWSAAA